MGWMAGMNDFNYGDIVLIVNRGKCHGLYGQVVGVWDQEGYYNCYKVKVRNTDPYVNTTICIKGKNLIKQGENIMAAKLTGYKQVAAIKQGYSTYYYAIYDDSRKYYPGDSVIVSGAASGMVQKIEEIVDPEEAAKRMGNKSITAEVIAYVDTSAYEERVAKRKEATELKKKMDQVIKQMDESNKYEMYAERNPELKDMLETYKKLTV